MEQVKKYYFMRGEHEDPLQIAINEVITTSQPLLSKTTPRN
jgi:hypothetical protein